MCAKHLGIQQKQLKGPHSTLVLEVGLKLKVTLLELNHNLFSSHCIIYKDTKRCKNVSICLTSGGKFHI